MGGALVKGNTAIYSGKFNKIRVIFFVILLFILRLSGNTFSFQLLILLFLCQYLTLVCYSQVSLPCIRIKQKQFKYKYVIVINVLACHFESSFHQSTVQSTENLFQFCKALLKLPVEIIKFVIMYHGLEEL